MEQEHGSVRVVRARRPLPAGRVKIGSQVITSDNRRGTLVGMSVSNDRVVVEDPSVYYGKRSFNLNQIAVTQGCVEGICVGDSVVTSDLREGRVVGFFADKRIVVEDPSVYYGLRQFTIDKLGIKEGCSDLFCIGDRVITGDNREGEVIAFNYNGSIVVKDPSVYYGNRNWDERKISLTRGVCANIFVERVEFCRR